MPAVSFAVPGDLNRKTGGTIYDRAVIEALRAAGHPVLHLELPGSYPCPTAPEEAQARAALHALPAEAPVIIDGLAFGAMTPETVAAIRAPILALVHHPLALETGLDPAQARALRRSETANLRLAAAVVVPSPHTGRILTSDFGVPPDRITVALPGMQPPDPVRAPVVPPLILSVGSLSPRKGHDTLLDALSRIADLQWQAEIVGPTLDPACATALTAQAAALGLTTRVRFAGPVDPLVLQSRYRAASLFALATRYEGYGMVFAEAMLHGLPCIGCATGAVPDTVPPEAGILNPPDDPGAFAHALRTLLTDTGTRTRMAGTATRHAATLPRWSETATIIAQVADRLRPLPASSL